MALDAKMNFDDNALFRHPTIEELRDVDEEDPTERRGRQVRAQLHQARRQYRLHGERRRPRDGDDGHHQALRRRAGEFPRCRRRRDRGAGDDRVQAHPLRPERQGDPGQHLRRHHALRRDRRRRRRRGARGRSAGAAGGAPRRHQRRTRQEDPAPSPGCRSSPPTISRTPREEGGARRVEGGGTDGHPRQARTPRSSARASPARRARSIPSRRSPTAPRWSAA